jgi:hypothetical protein
MNIFLVRFRVIYILVFFYFTSENSYSQGNGLRSALLSSVDKLTIESQWINLSQNLVPSGSIFVPGSDITVNVFPLTLIYTFNISGRYASVFANVVPGSTTGIVNLDNLGIDRKSFSTSGISDGSVAFKLGLIGAPALSSEEFSKRKLGFSMIFMLRGFYTGSYNSEKVMNMGTNRFTIETAWLMAVPIGLKKKFPFWLEITPSIEAYSQNHNPAPSSSGVNKIRQTPLFACESYLTKNLTSKLWVGIGWRAQYGATTIIDDTLDIDSKLNLFAGGFGMGYQLLPSTSLKASYGNVIWGDGGLESKMIRLNVAYTMFNSKKK